MRVFDDELRGEDIATSLLFETELVHLNRVATSEEALVEIGAIDTRRVWQPGGASHLLKWHRETRDEIRRECPAVVGLGLTIMHGGFERVPYLFPTKLDRGTAGMLTTAFKSVIWPAGVRFLAIRLVEEKISARN